MARTSNASGEGERRKIVESGGMTRGDKLAESIGTVAGTPEEQSVFDPTMWDQPPIIEQEIGSLQQSLAKRLDPWLTANLLNEEGKPFEGGWVVAFFLEEELFKYSRWKVLKVAWLMNKGVWNREFMMSYNVFEQQGAVCWRGRMGQIHYLCVRPRKDWEDAYRKKQQEWEKQIKPDPKQVEGTKVTQKHEVETTVVEIDEEGKKTVKSKTSDKGG